MYTLPKAVGPISVVHLEKFVKFLHINTSLSFNHSRLLWKNQSAIHACILFKGHYRGSGQRRAGQLVCSIKLKKGKLLKNILPGILRHNQFIQPFQRFSQNWLKAIGTNHGYFKHFYWKILFIGYKQQMIQHGGLSTFIWSYFASSFYFFFKYVNHLKFVRLNFVYLKNLTLKINISLFNTYNKEKL